MSAYSAYEECSYKLLGAANTVYMVFSNMAGESIPNDKILSAVGYFLSESMMQIAEEMEKINQEETEVK